jgi:signal transduction histidine kinase
MVNMIVNHSVKVLLVEDNLAEANLYQEFLKQNNSQEFSLFHTQGLQDTLQEISQNNYDLILLDLSLPDSEGLSSLTVLLEKVPSSAIVILTNTNDEELAIESVRLGAQDYLVKRQINPDLLIRSLQYAIERKQTLERLRQINQELEDRVAIQTAELVKVAEMNYIKSEFFSMFSHDIRNPLHTIQLAAQILQKSDEKLTMEKKKAHLEIIGSAIKNMSYLLDEISFISQSNTTRLKVQLSHLNLPEFCRQLVEESKFAALDNQVEVEFNLNGDFSQTIWDKNLLRHILSNLLVNAIKYSAPHSKVVFDLIRQEKTAIFRFQDQGIGISLTDQQYLFQPFYRGENVGKISGSGLGLAIVKKCIEAYAGEITVSSEIGIGTIFTLVLPVSTL